MQLHPVLDPSFIGALKRHLSSLRPSSSSPSSNNNPSAPPSLLNTNMAQRTSWSSSSSPSSLPSTVLSEPATSPPQTLLLFSLLESDLQGDGVRSNHGERTFRVEREDGIRVRDVMMELESFLWRRAPRVVGNLNSYRTLSGEDRKVGAGLGLGLEATLKSNSDSDSDIDAHSNSKSAATMVVSLEDVHGSSPDTSLSTFSSDIHLNTDMTKTKTKTETKTEIKQEAEYAETVLARWLGERTVFAGLKCVENHDYKLVVRMVKPKRLSSTPGRRELRAE